MVGFWCTVERKTSIGINSTGYATEVSCEATHIRDTVNVEIMKSDIRSDTAIIASSSPCVAVVRTKHSTIIRKISSWRYLYKSFTHIIQLAHSDKREYIINASPKFCPTEVIEERRVIPTKAVPHAKIRKKDESAAQPSKPC